jgi:GrpB-like predicted nucleotidyltransferase (UPF0157 family)
MSELDAHLDAVLVGGQRPVFVVLAEPDPSWPACFEEHRQRIVEAVGAVEVDHIGSTSVPGLAAKPVIDLMAPVVSLAASHDAIAAVVAAGYVHHPYHADVMHWFCRPSPARRTHHLHLLPIDSPTWRARLAFRDALRADAALRDAYARLKQQLARAHRDDREAYTDGKSAFVAEVLGRTAPDTVSTHDRGGGGRHA